jgi:hypothetical protein
MKTNAKLGIAGALALSLSVLSATDDADACGGFLDYQPEPQFDERPILVAAAEEQVEVGQQTHAAFGLIRSFPNVKRQQLGLSALGDRALHAMALAVVRADGTLPVVAFKADSDEARDGNIQWAVHVLHAYARRQPDNMLLTIELAEGLARQPARRLEAYRMLRSLEQRDLLADAHGYATLADLRRTSHEGKPAFVAHPLKALEDASARLAVARCRTMAKEQAICGDVAQAELAQL